MKLVLSDTLRMIFLGEKLKDKIVLFSFFLVRVPMSVVYFFSKEKHRHITSKLDRMLPSVRIKTDYGRFICRKNSYDWKVLHPSFEKNLKKYFLSLPLFGGAFIDVGAHIGLYTVMFGNKRKCKVVAIEPEESNFQTLLNNIKLNNLQVIPLKVACYSKNVDAVLHLFPEDEGGHSMVLKSKLKMMVKARKLDCVLKSLKIDPREVSVLKVDVEGAEKFVFCGAKRLLKCGKPRVVFEAWSKKCLNQIRKILEKFGYKRITKLDEETYLAEKG